MGRNRGWEGGGPHVGLRSRDSEDLLLPHTSAIFCPPSTPSAPLKAHPDPEVCHPSPHIAGGSIGWPVQLWFHCCPFSLLVRLSRGFGVAGNVKLFSYFLPFFSPSFQLSLSLALSVIKNLSVKHLGSIVPIPVGLPKRERWPWELVGSSGLTPDLLTRICT